MYESVFLFSIYELYLENVQISYDA